MSNDNKKPRIPLGGKSIDKGKENSEIKQNESINQNTDFNDNPFDLEKPIDKFEYISNDLDAIQSGSLENENNPFEASVSNPTDENFSSDPFGEKTIITSTSTPDPEPIINEPIPPSKEIVLEIDPNTTYFFIFGASAAGKSTMVSSLAYYLKAHADGQVESTSSADKSNHLQGDFLLNNMVKDVKKGVYVLRSRNLTDEELSSEINLQYRPENYKKAAFPFCILEMAGEDLQKVQLRDFGKSGGILDERINAYLEHPNCSLVFICALDVDDPSENEDFIDRFLDYARKLGHEQNPVLITINKWDLVADKYENGEAYLKENAPILYRKLHDPNRNFSYMPFSIGKKGAEKDYVYDPTDAKKLFDWMYEVSIGESLYDIKPPSLLDKLFSSFKSKFKK